MNTSCDIEKMNSQLPLIIRSSATFFIEAAKYLDKHYGFEGRKILRESTRNVGTWRGNQLRKAHHALNLPINMESLCNNWDSPSATKHLGEIWRTQGVWHPCNVAVPVPFIKNACESADLWVEGNDWMLGHIYCDEFHIFFVTGYHPSAIVVIPECIMKGDPQCSFRFMIPPNAIEPEQLELFENENPLQDWQGTGVEKLYGELRRKARITAGRMYFLFDSLKRAKPDDYEKIFTDIITLWTARRVEDEILKSKEQAYERTPYNLFANLDTPYEFVWKAKFNVEENNAFEMTIPYCPYLETWNWMGKGEDLSLFCDHCYVPLIQGYNNEYSAKLTQCMAKGDTCCKIIAEKLIKK